jgi:hypothetical protein
LCAGGLVGGWDLLRGLAEAIHSGQYSIGLRILGGRLLPLVAAGKERDAEPLFETGDLRTDGRLHQAYSCSRLHNGAVINDAAECLEEPYIH